MQPRPIAETSRPLFPSFRFCMALALLSSFFENFPCDRQRCARGRPARIEGEVGNRFDNLVARHAVLQRLLQVERQLVRAVQRNQACDGDEASVAGFQARSLPDIPEQDIVRVLRQRGCDVAKCFTSIVWHSCYSFVLICGPARYCSSVTFSIQSTFLPFNCSVIAICDIPVLGVAPCQCLWFGGHQMTSPARISTIGSPSHWVQPKPDVTTRVCPSGCVCQAERAPGSNVTIPAVTREGSGAWIIGSIRTAPVKYSSGPF